MQNVIVVGAGGLGTPASWGLVESWQNSYSKLNIQIYDPDVLELSNLNRQVLYSEKDLGKPKAELLNIALGKRSPKNITLNPHKLAITEENISLILKDADYVIEGSDSTETKFLINDYCVANKIPFCYAGVIAERGLLLEVLPNNGHSACLRCLFGNFTKDDFDVQNASCQQSGILGPVAGFVGFLQAECVLSYLLDGNNSQTASTSKYIRFNLDPFSLVESRLSVDQECPHILNNSVKLDLTDKVCPSTFLYTKLMLEKLELGAKLEVFFNSEESARNVSRTMGEMGHLIEGYRFDETKKTWVLEIRKNDKPN